MNLNKHLEFLSPAQYEKALHVIGVGAVGSRIAEFLVRLGFPKINIYDFDTVDDINIPNQIYTSEDLGMEKVDALERHLKRINPKVEVRKFSKGYSDQTLSGAVFLAVDSIDLRRSIVEENMYNNNIDVMFDGRMRLTDSQYFGAVWSKPKDRNSLLNSMQFTDEDADKATPVSACGSSLSVVPTVITLASLVTANFINFIKGEKVANMAMIDPFQGSIDSMFY